MRRFSSYGPINRKTEYYAPREELIDKAYTRLTGANTDEGGHYITVWGPRQRGKTWIMQQMGQKIKEKGQLEFAFFSMEPLKDQTAATAVIKTFCKELARKTKKKLPLIETWEDLPALFTK
ncbi:MAG: hypothetical protein GY757_34630, partial [bacterium]|nr:hypothetical protein [bacterium]